MMERKDEVEKALSEIIRLTNEMKSKEGANEIRKQVVEIKKVIEKQ